MAAAPDGFRATSVSPSEVDMSWDDTSHEDGYAICQLVGDTWEQIAYPESVEDTYTVTGLVPGATYQFSVQASYPDTAYGGSYFSDVSNSVTVTMPSGRPSTPVGFRATAASGSEVDMSWNDTSHEDGYAI
ncbi:fibronectin type III domain-containing protein, partial [Bradyrhizobium sp. NBAIM08]|uniref:fibronectin type III domain-containing protein n=1 Tax=Bradyrhizobium sp. NBAIM08 TaxID=2793815 RepID=UPI001CD51BF3